VCIYTYSFIHPVPCLTTGPQHLPKRVLHRLRSSASSFNLYYPLVSLRSSSRCLRFLPRLPVTSILLLYFLYTHTHYRRRDPTHHYKARGARKVSNIRHPLQIHNLRDFRLSPLCGEAFALLGCCAEWIGSLLPTFRDNLSVPSARVKQFKSMKHVPKRLYPATNLRLLCNS